MAGKAPAQDASSSQWGKMTGRYVKQFMVGRGVLGRVFKAVDIGEAAGLGSAGRWVKRSGRSLRGPSAFADKGIDVAIKVIDLEDVEDTLDMVAREVEALTRVRCVWAGGGGAGTRARCALAWPGDEFMPYSQVPPDHRLLWFLRVARDIGAQRGDATHGCVGGRPVVLDPRMSISLASEAPMLDSLASQLAPRGTSLSGARWTSPPSRTSSPRSSRASATFTSPTSCTGTSRPPTSSPQASGEV